MELADEGALPPSCPRLVQRASSPFQHQLAGIVFMLSIAKHLWIEAASFLVQACQLDVLLDQLVPGTCAWRYLRVDVEPVDDAPTVFSLEYPWALPVETMEDTSVQLCCFTILDPDVRSAGATSVFSGSPWLFRMRVMAKYGNISMAAVGSVVVTERTSKLISLEGYAADVETALDSIIYSPLLNMNSNHAMDHLCIFLADSPGSKRIGSIRRFTGCWVISIEPVNDEPVLTQLFEGTSLEPTCDSLELVNETFENLTGNLTCAAGVRFRLENHGGENAYIPLPPVRIDDVDAEEVVTGDPALSVLVRAELGHIQPMKAYPGLDVRKGGTELHGYWWELRGNLSVLNTFLSSGLMYQPPTSTFHGNDAVWVNASDLGHHGLSPTGFANGTAQLKMLLHVYRVELPLTLDGALSPLPEAMEDAVINVTAFKLSSSSKMHKHRFLGEQCTQVAMQSSTHLCKQDLCLVSHCISGYSEAHAGFSVRIELTSSWGLLSLFTP